jgi:hypothetical protein
LLARPDDFEQPRAEKLDGLTASSSEGSGNFPTINEPKPSSGAVLATIAKSYGRLNRDDLKVVRNGCARRVREFS